MTVVDIEEIKKREKDVVLINGARHRCFDTTELHEIPSFEIVRCKDCKWWHREIHNGVEYFNFNSCDLNHCGYGHNFYCADAERRTDE